MEMLRFRLPGHGDTTLKHLNSLRSRQHFCDITIVASDNQTFKGHKVVLAACSPFLRDQFLLNPSPKLQVCKCQQTKFHTVNSVIVSLFNALLLRENSASLLYVVSHFYPGVDAVQLQSGV